MWIGDARARERALTALREEGLVSRLVTASDFAVHGLTGAPAAALVYDMAPWNDEAIKFLRRLREKPLPVANLPVLIYAPSRPEVGRLLVEAGRLPLVLGELQYAEGSDIARLRRAIRQLLAVAPAAVVFRLLMLHARHLPQRVVQFCRVACERLAAGRGDTPTVTLVASALGADRRTLERRWRSWNLPAPKELLDWIIVVFAAYLTEQHRVQLYAAGELMGMTHDRLRRCRLRLRRLPKADGGVALVLAAFARRLNRTPITSVMTDAMNPSR